MGCVQAKVPHPQAGKRVYKQASGPLHIVHMHKGEGKEQA